MPDEFKPAGSQLNNQAPTTSNDQNTQYQATDVMEKKSERGRRALREGQQSSAQPSPPKRPYLSSDIGVSMTINKYEAGDID